MSNRGLAQITVSFLLGILSSRYGNPGVYGIWAGCLLWLGIWTGWLVWLGFTAWRQVNEACFLRISGRLAVCLLSGLLGYQQYDRQQAVVISVEQYLTENTEATVSGTIYKKEEKNENIIYYLKDSYIIYETDYLSSDQILIYLKADEYSIGDTIQVKGSCESFKTARNEGNFNAKAYYYSKNILFRVKADSVQLLKRQKILWQEKLYQLRKKMQEVYVQKLPEQEAGVLAVMTLGEKGMLDTEIKNLYQQSGISHVLAISGLHISILGMSIYRFLRKLGASYVWSGLTAGILVLIFGQISGMELSTVRALTMFVVMLLGNTMGMAYDSVTALSLSALLQLWENPFGLWNTGFILSYSAVLAVVVAAKVLQEGRVKDKKAVTDKKTNRFRKGIGKIKNTIFMSGCIQLVTLPLTVYFYYEFPVYSVCINGLLLPFMGIVLLSGILGGLTGLLSGIWKGMAALLSDGLSWILLQPAYGLLKWNEWICGIFQKLPGAVWITGRPSLGMMIGYYVALAIALGMINGLNGKIHNEEKQVGKHKKNRIIVITAILAAMLLLLTIRPKQQFQVCFLDVGQGDGIYIQADTGESFFIDGGSTSERKVGEYRILSFLKYHGVRHVDGWFVSHGDTDHISGLLEIWERGYQIKNLFLAEAIVKDEPWQELCDMAKKHQTNIIYLKPGDSVGTEDLKMTCLHPWEEGEERNTSSLVLKLEYPGLTGIFAGDISSTEEQKLIKKYSNLKADLYKAAHHGSNGSGSKEFLERLSPVLTIVSCGKDNSYGHPGKEAMERIAASGSRIFYTMEGGQITVGSDEGGIWVREYKTK